MKKQILITTMLLVAVSIANAQSWLLNGNNNVTDTSKLGSINQKPVRFVAANSEKMRLTTGGNLGIGIFAPTSRLHVVTTATVPATFDGGAGMFIRLLEGGVYRGYLGSFAGDPTDVDFGTGFSNTTGKLHLAIQGVPKLTVDASGFVGIGTTTPENTLHVFKGSAGTITAAVNAPLVVENSTNSYINLLAPSAAETGVLFGDNLNAQDGGIIYNGANQLQFRNNGNGTRMIIDPDGNTGIDLDPLNTGFNAARLQVRSNGNDNIRLVAADNVNDWSLFSNNGTTGNLSLFKNGNFRGFFDATSGLYTSSDKRLKKDITELPHIMESVMKLQPRKYHYKESPDSVKYSYGFIAQDVNQIFPEFVGSYQDRKSGEERFALNYDNFGVIAIKAIQELQKEIEGLKETVKNLSAAQSKTTGIVSGSLKTSEVFTGAKLEQNVPNPFNNNTSVSYNLPEGIKNAQLLISDATGRIIQQTQLNKAGSGTIKFNSLMLKSGTYTYSLLINGSISESRKMIVAK